MNVVRPLIELGIDFVPVPGVKPAFDILIFIWDNVEKASNNREALRNLTVSAADILTAVHYVLLENEPNKHVRDMLRKLESVLTDIRLFAAEHANMNLFKLLLKNVDVDGRIEFFQNRLQNLWVAFNIVALGSIGSEVHLIRQGQPRIQSPTQMPSSNTPKPLNPPAGRKAIHVPTRPPAPKRTVVLPSPKGTNVPPRPPSPKRTIVPPRLPAPKATAVPPQPQPEVLVGASSSTPFKIEVRSDAPLLSSRYNDNEALYHWGLRTTEIKVTKKLNTFEIVQQRDAKKWKWTLAGKVISVSRHDPEHPRWKDSMDLAFSNGDSAMPWFSWLGVYASSLPTTKTLRDPPSPSEVTLRKKNSHSKMLKLATTINYKRPTHDWVTIMRGHSRSARDHASQFTYFSTSNDGRLPFCTVYRSGDTLVHERFIRADSWDPTVSRRYRFDTENEARTWYSFWKECVMANDGDDEPSRVELVTKYDCEIKPNNDDPVLSSRVWPDVKLRDWRTPKFKNPETFFSTDFRWNYDKDTITVNATIFSRPNWFENLEIGFRDTQSAFTWFTYLTGYETGTEQSSSTYPPTENVSITNRRVCWMRNAGQSIDTRAATSDKWVAVFGKNYERMDEHGSHVSLVTGGSSVLPIIRIWMNGNTLHLDRRRSVGEHKSVVSRRYIFDSEAEAQAWYDRWREHLKTVAPLISK